MNTEILKTEIERLERICDDAYSLDIDGLKAAIKSVGASQLKNEYPFLTDAVLTHLMWIKGTKAEQSDESLPGVYVILYESGMIKIGKTKNFKQRLKTLASATPHRPSKTHFHPTDKHSEVESMLHRHFKERRANGEFFRVEFDVAVAELNRLCYIPFRQPPQEADRVGKPEQKAVMSRSCIGKRGFFTSVHQTSTVSIMETVHKGTSMMEAPLAATVAATMP